MVVVKVLAEPLVGSPKFQEYVVLLFMSEPEAVNVTSVRAGVGMGEYLMTRGSGVFKASRKMLFHSEEFSKYPPLTK